MKLAITLTFCFATSLTQAQVWGDTLLMHFDGPGATLVLDSVYPAGCWQVGVPDKTVFTSAWSPPHALVTDTVAPHAANTTCYAEFTATFVDGWAAPGRWLTFRHRLDMDSLDSFGWLEHAGPWSQEWVPAGFFSDLALLDLPEGALWTDTGVVYTGSNAGWSEAVFDLMCIAVVGPNNDERGGGGDGTSVRLRFAFKGNDNPNGRDGWMIDDVRVAATGCWGSVPERDRPALQVHPNPATDRLFIDVGTDVSGALQVELLDPHGRVVMTQRNVHTPAQPLDVSTLAAGHYFCRVITRQHVRTVPVMIFR